MLSSQALKVIRAIVDAQTEDEALWIKAETESEAYLQQELCQLHSCIKRYTQSKVYTSK